MTYSGSIFDNSHLPQSEQNVAKRRAVDMRTSSKVRPLASVIRRMFLNLSDAAFRRIAPMRCLAHHSGPFRSICVSKYRTRIITFSSKPPGVTGCQSIFSPPFFGVSVRFPFACRKINGRTFHRYIPARIAHHNHSKHIAMRCAI